MTCPVCGTVPVPGARYCHACGAALAGVIAAPAAERRVVTVLFGDLSDFTAWSEGVDPERVGAVTDRVLAALAAAVRTFGGHVDKLTGDGIMAVFGAPVAHEDDPERAVRTALAMQRAVRRVLDEERGGGAPAGLRIGLNTGEVVAGVQAALEYTVIGDTVNTAARLADAATLGTVYAGAATSTATRHVAAWRRLLPLRLKGKRHAVEAYELLGPLDAPGTRSGLGDEGPFVGRQAELALVTSRLGEVVDRREVRALVFTAEAGLGKTRLGAEVARLAADFDARFLSVRCAAYGERRRLGPLADLVRTAIGLDDQPAATRVEAEEKLRRVARRTGQRLTLPVEPLLALLGYGDTDLASVASLTSQRPGTDAAAETAPAAVAVAELITALAAETPLVVAVDDLHDAGPQTVDALGATLSRVTGPVLVVLFGRPEVTRTAGALTRLADAEVHQLPPLRGADAARLLTAYLGGGRLPPPDTDHLLATAQGNPFYLSELVTLLMERGVLTRAGGHWRLAPGSLSGRLLSRDLAAVLAARIDALPPEARAVLRDASVVGDVVPAAALLAVREQRMPARPAAVAAVDLERSLDELLRRRMFLPTRTGYAFATPLLREAAYAGVGKADRAERHAHLARWAADPGPAGPVLPGAAGPVLRGPAGFVLPGPAGPVLPGPVGWTADARDTFIAEQAERAAALADAVALRLDAAPRSVADLGVAALGRLADRAIRAGEPRPAEHFADRATALARGPLPAGDRVVHASALLQLGRAAEALAIARVVATDAAADPESRARALLLTGRAHRRLGDPDRADGAWRAALDLATAADLAAVRGEALRRMGMEEYLEGRLREADERFRQALAIADEAADRRGQAWALQNLAWVATTLGDFGTADATLSRAARLFAEQGDASGRAWLRGTTAFARLLAGRLVEARRLAEAFLPFGERVGEHWAVGTLRAVGAFAAAELGDLATADQQARRAYRQFETIDDDWGRGLALVVRGVVARGLGEPAHAVDLLSDACRLGERTGHPLLHGVAGTIRGFAFLDAGDPVSAEADAHASLAVIKPHDVVEAARVGPRVLLASARLAVGDAQAALAAVADVAASGSAASLLVPRRLAVAVYAKALLAEGRRAEAVAAAQRAIELPAEDVRSRVVSATVLAEALAAAGETEQARAAAGRAVRTAYSTQQRGERAAADATLSSLSVEDAQPPPPTQRVVVAD